MMRSMSSGRMPARARQSVATRRPRRIACSWYCSLILSRDLGRISSSTGRTQKRCRIPELSTTDIIASRREPSSGKTCPK